MLKIFKICVAVLVLLTTVTFLSEKVEAKNFGESEYQEVVINQNLMNQRRYVQAKVKLNIYKADGRLNNWRSVRVVMKDQNNNIIWQGNHKGGILKLGNDHAIYRIYVVDPKKPSGFVWSVDATQWNLEPVSGCYFR